MPVVRHRRARRPRPASRPRRSAAARRTRSPAPSGRDAVATRSRSLQVSAQRRALPAISTRSAAGCSRSASRAPRAIRERLREQELRLRAAVRAGGERRAGCSPRPWRRTRGSSRSCCASAACFSSSSEAMPSSSKSLRARFGPEPREARDLDEARRDTSPSASRPTGSSPSRAARRSSPRSSCRSRRARSTRARRASSPRPTRRTRGSPWPRCGRRATRWTIAPSSS